MKKFYCIIAAAIALGLAACSEEKAEAPANPPAQQSAPAKTEAAPPAAAPQAASKSTSASDMQAFAEKACLDGVAKETSESKFSVISYEFSEANSEVMVGVGPDRAPWRCLVSNDGSVSAPSALLGAAWCPTTAPFRKSLSPATKDAFDEPHDA